MPRLALLLPALALAADPQTAVDDAHARSASLRREMLRDWTFPPSGYFATFAGAPVQHAIAAMYLDENATAVAVAEISPRTRYCICGAESKGRHHGGSRGLSRASRARLASLYK